MIDHEDGLAQTVPSPHVSFLEVEPPRVVLGYGTIRAKEGEKVIVSGADEITGWRRDGDTWAAPLRTRPARVLMDGKPFEGFTIATRRVSVSGVDDPRMHLFEAVVRDVGIDAAGVDVKIEGIEVTNTVGSEQ